MQTNNVIKFPGKTNDFLKSDSLLMMDQLAAMNDLWNLLFKQDTYVRKTNKVFKANVSNVLKEMLFVADWPSLKLGTKKPVTGNFSYFSHEYIRRETNLPKWTYYNVVNFLEKSHILYLDKKNIHTVSAKKLSPKLFETLNFLLLISSPPFFRDPPF